MKIRIGNHIVRIAPEAVSLAGLFDMVDDPILVANINCGLHSGINPCCVIHFMMVHTTRDSKGKWRTANGQLLRTWETAPTYEMILCPRCRIDCIIATPLERCLCWQKPDSQHTIEFAE